MKQRKPETKPMLIHIPAEVKRAFRSWCIMHEVTMTDQIIALMRRTIRKGHRWPQ